MLLDSIDRRRFPHAAENLGYYVYALVDPKTGVPFYIGKGGQNARGGSRYRSHLPEQRCEGESKGQ